MSAVICEAGDHNAALAEAELMLEDARQDDPSESVSVTVYGLGAVLVGKRYRANDIIREQRTPSARRWTVTSAWECEGGTNI